MDIFCCKGLVIIYRLWGGTEKFRGDHLILGEQRGESDVTENPKGGIAENFGRIQRGDHPNLLVK